MGRRGSFVWACSAVMIAAGLAACAAHGWHAPRAWASVSLLVLGLTLGVTAAYLRFRASKSSAGVFELALAGALGLLTILGTSVGVAMVIQDWGLHLASFVGSLWMGTWPLQIVLVHSLLQRPVEIGIDDLRVGAKLIPLRSVRTVSHAGNLVQVDHGSITVIPLATEHDARELAEQVRARLGGAAPPAHLAREGRSLEAWKRELLSPGYRSARLAAEDAARVLESASAKPEERVAAAIVLAESGAREKVRVAAMSCADPRTRVALEAVADDSLDDRKLARLRA